MGSFPDLLILGANDHRLGDNVSTIVSKDASLVERGIATVDLIAGVDIKAIEAAKRAKKGPITAKPKGNGVTNSLPNPPSLMISHSQWGTKSAQYMRNFNLDVSNPAHRQKFRGMVENIGSKPDRVVTGTFSGGRPTGRRDVHILCARQ